MGSNYMFSVVAQDPALELDVNLKPNAPISVSNLVEVVADDLQTLNKSLQSVSSQLNSCMPKGVDFMFIMLPLSLCIFLPCIIIF